MFKFKTYTNGDFIKKVDIFNSTPAMDIPGKLSAIAIALKEYINNMNTNTKSYLLELVNGDGGIVAYVNTYISDTKANLSNYISTNPNNTYTVSAINSALGCGELRDITYDNKSRINGYKNGVMAYSSIEYNDDDNIIKYVEAKTIGAISESITYIVSYFIDGKIKTILKENK